MAVGGSLVDWQSVALGWVGEGEMREGEIREVEVGEGESRESC